MPSAVASLIATPHRLSLYNADSADVSDPPRISPSVGIHFPGSSESCPHLAGHLAVSPPSLPHFPPVVSATPTAITLRPWKTSRNTFKRSSLKSLTPIGISSSFTKLCLLQSIIVTKPSVGSSPITSIGFSRNVRSLSFFSPIRTAQRGLPAVPAPVTQRITTALELAYLVAQGKSPPVSDSNLKKDCGHRIPYIVYSKRKPAVPNLEADFPPMPYASLCCHS